MKKNILLLLLAVASLVVNAQRTVTQALSSNVFSVLLQDALPGLQKKIYNLTLKGKITAHQDVALTRPYNANDFKMIGGYTETVNTASGTDSVVVNCIAPENIAGLQLHNAATLAYLVDYEKAAYFSLVQLKTYLDKDEAYAVQLVESGAMFSTGEVTDFNYYLSTQGESIYLQIKDQLEAAVKEKKVTLYADNTFKKALKKEEVTTEEPVEVLDENNRETTTIYAAGLENIAFVMKITPSGNTVEAEWLGLSFMLMSGYSGDYINPGPYYLKATDAMKLLDKSNADLLRRAVLFQCYAPVIYEDY